MTYKVYYVVWLLLQLSCKRCKSCGLRQSLFPIAHIPVHTVGKGPPFRSRESEALPPAYCWSCCMQSPLLNHLPFLEVRTDHHYSHYPDPLPPSQLNSRANNGSFALGTEPLPLFLCLLPACLLIFISHSFCPLPVVCTPFKSSARLYIHLSGLGTAWCS